MRFLFINQYYAPDYAASAQQLSDLCEYLVTQGHEVHVVASRSLYDGRSFDLPAEEIINGVHVHRVKLALGIRRRLRDRLVDYVSFYRRAFWKVTFLPRADVVVTLTTPPMIALLGSWLRLVHRARFVCWVMDIYPDIAHRARVLPRFTPMTTLWSLLGRFGYMTANRVVVLGECMKRVLESKGVPESRLSVIPSWSCGESIRPITEGENGFRRAHHREGRFTIMYSGNMGTCHCFDAVIKAAHELEAAGDPVDFLFVGAGKRKAQLEERMSGLSNVRFLPYQDRAALAESLGAADAHLITLYPEFDGLLVPSKLYGILAAAKPVIFVGGEENEVAVALRNGRCGLRVGPDQAEDLVAGIRGLVAHPQRTRRMGESGRQFFLDRFDRRDTCAQFCALLEQEAHLPGLRGKRPLAPLAVATTIEDREASS